MNSADIYNVQFKMKHLNRDFNSNVSGGYCASKNSKKDEASAIRLKFPTKIPIIVERYYKENDLPHLEKKKFLVPQEVTMSQFISILRNRMKLSHTKALFLLIDNRSMPSLSRTIAELYNDYRNDDGFLYITYASQDVFG